jgi:feruloyl esterase
MRLTALLTAANTILPATGAQTQPRATQVATPSRPATLTQADCTAARLTAAIAPAQIGEPVSGVTLAAPAWVAPAANLPAYCRVDGSLLPVDTSATARPINFRVVLPASWNRRAVQMGGGGINGVIPPLTAGDGPGSMPLIARGLVTYGSDSGHQIAPGRRGEPPPAGQDDWALNDEAIRNLGYMQMKKTHDAAMILIERAYGSRPRFNYYVGTSQGGREALTVAQRYPGDYDGIAANVPIVHFSTLMLAPPLIRIQEKPIGNWVTPAKVNAIRAEFMRQCDRLDGLVDGVINNYVGCRAIFDVTQGIRNRRPWSAKRCAAGVDPNPTDTSASACFSDGQISTLQFVYSHYRLATPLVNGVRQFGMWLPNTDPSGSGLIVATRFRGQAGAAADAPAFPWLGALGVTGFLMKDLQANPLDYVEGGPLNRRREELSRWLDSTDPDLSRFAQRGGKAIVTIGTNDTLASPGAQLDYYQAVLDKMGSGRVDRFARFFVMPQTGHGLTGTTGPVDGTGQPVASLPIPNTFDRLTLLFDWVETGTAPPRQVVVTAGDRSLPLCSYPTYPRYTSGPPSTAAAYVCSRP